MISAEHAFEYYKSLEEEIHTCKGEIEAILEVVNKSTEFQLEGNCFYYGEPRIDEGLLLNKRANFVNSIRDFKITKMMEIGFNAGHSAACFLAAMPKDGEFLSFDLDDHPYMRFCFDHLRKKYPQLQEVICGDSKVTLPNYVHAHPEKREYFDCIHVDGAHDQTVATDIMYSDYLLKPGGILILDDVNVPIILYGITQCLKNGYQFVYQIPTYCYPHVVLQKHRISDWASPSPFLTPFQPDHIS